MLVNDIQDVKRTCCPGLFRRLESGGEAVTVLLGDLLPGWNMPSGLEGLRVEGP
jgi:hypothetical protein